MIHLPDAVRACRLATRVALAVSQKAPPRITRGLSIKLLFANLFIIVVTLFAPAIGFRRGETELF